MKLKINWIAVMLVFGFGIGYFVGIGAKIANDEPRDCQAQVELIFRKPVDRGKLDCVCKLRR